MTDKTEPRPADPLRRQPPVIDLPAGDFGRAAPPRETDGSLSASTADEPATAIEPIAATGLDGGSTSPGSALGREKIVRGAFGERPAPEPPAESGEDLLTGMTKVEARPGADRKPATTFGRLDDEDGAPLNRDVAARTARGFGSLAAASLLGGVVGAALIYAGEAYKSEPVTDLGPRVAALEARPRAPATPAAPADTSGIDRRVAALETQARTLADGVAAARSAAEAGARQAAEALARPAATAPAAAAPTEPDPALRQALDALTTRLGAIEESSRGAAPASALGEIRTQLQTAQRDAEERARAAAEAGQALQSAAAGLTQRTAAIDTRIAGLAAEVAKLPPGLMQAGLRVVVAGQIGDALRAGAPLGPGLAALEKLGGGGQTEPLKPFASQPAPSLAVLLAEFRPIAERIGAEPTGAGAGIGDRLLRVAEKIVTVRSIGDGSGTDVPGLLARIEAALARGATAEALAAWQLLPEPARRNAADWGARLGARAAAEAAARRIGQDALAALDAPTR